MAAIRQDVDVVHRGVAMADPTVCSGRGTFQFVTQRVGDARRRRCRRGCPARSPDRVEWPIDQGVHAVDALVTGPAWGMLSIAVCIVASDAPCRK